MSNLIELLGIQTVSVSKTKVIISLEVTDSVKQPYGIVHGGINSVLAETAASIGANGLLDSDRYAVGINISTQHLMPAKSGTLVATAEPLHVGNRIQTWQVEIANNNVLTSTSVVTLTTLKK
ncbi:putative esterase [Lentilactobacillus parabuchneri]|uniref:Putative esterase n=1 Tax=Lentilactobacillus parabuchneri TaxID=152331 RepID=A0A1X1FGF2_9LACO|nr:PaaI family thioesterase [Lentilactobacillus parabuchneri]APR06871.1 Putative esterase [Lentilactobacillus parabuchneri]MBW0223366.1 PaaI family thioesterase [Lentilactobacillus parabuchneri]MBW0246408.1 PaaI family thioesterase [Lentilactobacillus parabuchneri]MBW0263251.1 PaaI family thioesterase [Lentilactobacillus parabuchneri]MCT2884969.1 PaaI family thioesterase [Lentilactobacillus parabuchneri]